MNLSEQAPRTLPIHYSPGLSPLNAVHTRLLAEVRLQVAAAHPLPEQVQLILTDDTFIRRLNAAYRGKDMVTDVLSFDLGPGVSPGTESIEGEIYISLERVQIQADEQGVPLFEELARLLAHGLLHLSGHDHDTPEGLRFMEEETEHVLQAAGVVAPPPPA